MSRWWRAYDDALNNPKLQRLNAALFRSWFNLCCVASRNGGVLPPIEDLAFALRVTEPQASRTITELMEAGLVDLAGERFEMHDWKDHQYQSDNSTERVKRFRERSNGVSETPPETEQNTEQKQIARDSFDEFWKAYPRRDGANPKEPARKQFLACVKAGTEAAAIIAGARRCAEKESKNIGTPYIPQAIKWLRDKRWEDYNAAAIVELPSKEAEEKSWVSLLETHERTGVWPSQRIPEPGRDGCPISQEFIENWKLSRFAGATP